MSYLLHVHLLPALMDPAALRGATVVIIDILRASSTIVTALNNGASRVIPCGTPEEALRIRDALPPDSVILGGERGGVRIAGFDLGNSPAEYPRARIEGMTIAFTTTNGTRALLPASQAAEILIGSFLNRRAIVNRLRHNENSVHLVCAGTNGVVTGEDVLFAGALVCDILQDEQHGENLQNDDGWHLNDSASIAAAFWRQSLPQLEPDNPGLSQQLQTVLRSTQGGRNLQALGYDRDIVLCSEADTVQTIPRFDHHAQAIVVDG